MSQVKIIIPFQFVSFAIIKIHQSVVLLSVRFAAEAVFFWLPTHFVIATWKLIPSFDAHCLKTCAGFQPSTISSNSIRDFVASSQNHQFQMFVQLRLSSHTRTLSNVSSSDFKRLIKTRVVVALTLPSRTSSSTSLKVAAMLLLA